MQQRLTGCEHVMYSVASFRWPVAAQAFDQSRRIVVSSTAPSRLEDRTGASVGARVRQHPAELLGASSQAALELGPGIALALPGGEVAYWIGRAGSAAWMLPARCAVELGEVTEHDPDRPAVRRDVVEHEEQQVILFRELHERHPEEQIVRDVERLAGTRADHGLSLGAPLRVARETDRHAPHGSAVRDAPPQTVSPGWRCTPCERLVPGGERSDGTFKRADVHGPVTRRTTGPL